MTFHLAWKVLKTMKYHDISLFLLLLAVSFGCGEKQRDASFQQRAQELNKRILVLDSHVDVSLDYATETVDPGVLNDSLQVDLVKMTEGGVDGVFLAAYTPQGSRDRLGYDEARKIAKTRIEAIRRLCGERYPDRVELACSPDEVLRIAGRGRRAVAIGMENGYPIGRDLSMLEDYYSLGVRYVTLCHNGHNDICDSANPPNPAFPDSVPWSDPSLELLKAVSLSQLLDSPAVEAEHGGLSEFGRQVVARMNRLGMIVDLSHAGESTFWQVLELSQAPVIASHSSCRALCDMARNLNDEQLKALKENGGCVQITAVKDFIKLPAEQREALNQALEKIGMSDFSYGEVLNLYQEKPALYDRILAAYLEEQEGIRERFPPPDLRDFVDHID